MVVCVECLPADKPWDVVPATRRSSGVGPRAGVRVYDVIRVLVPVPPNMYIDTYWLLHDIVITNIVWCMACKGRVGERSYNAQRSRNSISVMRVMQMGGGNKGMIDSCTSQNN